MTNNLFHGSVSYKVHWPCYKPSIDGEELNIAQANRESSLGFEIQKSTLTVSLLETDFEFILKLDTHFFETDLLQAKEWFANYQDWVFASFVLHTNAVLRLHQSVVTISLSPTPREYSIGIGIQIGMALQVWSSFPLLQKLGSLSFLQSEIFATTDERIKVLYKQYKTCLQCEDPIARYMLLYNLLFQINEYQGRGDRQADIDNLIKEVIQEAKDREEFIKNQETYRPDSPAGKKSKRKPCETIYTCLRNEIAHKRTHRILVLDDRTESSRKLNLEQTICDINHYVSFLSRIVQLSILNLSSKASLDSSEEL